MATSISGGVHFGSDDGAPYYSLTAQVGTLPTISVAVGPVTSLSISGGITGDLLPTELTAPLAGNILDILPPPLNTVLNFEQGDGPGLFSLIDGTQIELPIGIANPWLLS